MSFLLHSHVAPDAMSQRGEESIRPLHAHVAIRRVGLTETK